MKTSKIILMSAIVVAAMGFTACDDDDDDYVVNKEATIGIGAPSLTDKTSTYAALETEISLGSLRYTGAGYVYNTTGMPTIYDNAVKGEVVDGHTVKATIKGLLPNKVYYVRAYVSQYDGECLYSSEITVDTSEGELGQELANYQAPAYPDYYVAQAGWDQRGSWNLANVHDPTVMLADDGYYYMYQTDASYGNAHSGHGHFHGRRSKDLVNWEYLGGTMMTVPAWVNEKANELRKSIGLTEINVTEDKLGYWAPVARNIGGGKYRMYYSIVLDAYPLEEGTKGDYTAWSTPNMIGMMETTDPASNVWEDKGFVISASSDRNKNWWWAGPNTSYGNAYYYYNAIDPTYIITPEGKHWLIYGSWHSGFAAVEVDAETGKPVNALASPFGASLDDIATYGQRIYTRHSTYRWQGTEGPEVVYRNGYYYLFLACDGLDVPYNTRVVRSQSITGPYTDMNGAEVPDNRQGSMPIVTHPYKFGGDPGWVGISHVAVWNDGADNWYLACQGRLPEGAYDNAYANANMLGHVRRILWSTDGWPIVLPERYGAVPQPSVAESELIGAWEHILLAYKAGEQDASEALVLGSDHKVTEGPWKDAEWSYDVTTQILKIGNAELHVTRECDWEASPRKHTIVFAGYAGTETHWGKKS